MKHRERAHPSSGFPAKATPRAATPLVVRTAGSTTPSEVPVTPPERVVEVPCRPARVTAVWWARTDPQQRVAVTRPCLGRFKQKFDDVLPPVHPCHPRTGHRGVPVHAASWFSPRGGPSHFVTLMRAFA
ncbi:hypothetical protein Acsp04_60470 [Actinomadura sp. NBRC 104425]|nr:hypothetical protein Acsp04_60470 [Actinomadura sp. NBRC 104425]